MPGPESEAGERCRRVLLLTPDYPPARGGIQTLLAHLVEHARGLDFSVVTLAEPGDRDHDRVHLAPVRRVGVPGKRLARPAAIAALGAVGIEQALRRRPDLVLSGHIVTAPSAAAIGRLLGVPFVQYLYAMEMPARPALTRFALARARATVVLSGYARALALQAGASLERIHTIPPGIDIPAAAATTTAAATDDDAAAAATTTAAATDDDDAAAATTTTAAATDDDAITAAPAAAFTATATTAQRKRATRPTILTIARLREPYKGHDVLIRALPLIRARVPEVEWIVIGEGPLRPALEEQARALGVASHIRFLGSVSDGARDEWLSCAQLLAMPSRLPGSGLAGEGFGIVFLEAAAWGLPVVAGAVGGALDAVRDGVTGRLVDPADPNAVAEAIAEILLDPAYAARLGEQGMEWAQRFAWPRIAARFQELALETIASAS